MAEFARAGGTVVVTALSGIVDPRNQVRAGGYPGAFRDLLGVVGEEFRPLQDGEGFTLDTGWTGTEWTEQLIVRDADVLARYQGGDLDGRPAVTSRSLPSGGRAVYVGAGLDAASVRALTDVLGPGDGADVPDGVEVLVREDGRSEFTFHLNHRDDDVVVLADGLELLTGLQVESTVVVPARSVRVVQSELGEVGRHHSLGGR